MALDKAKSQREKQPRRYITSLTRGYRGRAWDQTTFGHPGQNNNNNNKGAVE